MSDWITANDKAASRASQFLSNSIASSEMKHKIKMGELYERAKDIDVSAVMEGKEKLDAIEAILK